jgi:hypothetical protein
VRAPSSATDNHPRIVGFSESIELESRCSRRDGAASDCEIFLAQYLTVEEILALPAKTSSPVSGMTARSASRSAAITFCSTMMVVMPRSHLPAFVRLLQLRHIQASTTIR